MQPPRQRGEKKSNGTISENARTFFTRWNFPNERWLTHKFNTILSWDTEYKPCDMTSWVYLFCFKELAKHSASSSSRVEQWSIARCEHQPSLPSKCAHQTHYMTSDNTNDWFEAHCPAFHVDYEPIRSTDVSLLQLNNEVNIRESHLALCQVINYRLTPWSNLSLLLTSLLHFLPRCHRRRWLWWQTWTLSLWCRRDAVIRHHFWAAVSVKALRAEPRLAPEQEPLCNPTTSLHPFVTPTPLLGKTLCYLREREQEKIIEGEGESAYSYDATCCVFKQQMARLMTPNLHFLNYKDKLIFTQKMKQCGRTREMSGVKFFFLTF